MWLLETYFKGELANQVLLNLTCMEDKEVQTSFLVTLPVDLPREHLWIIESFIEDMGDRTPSEETNSILETDEDLRDPFRSLQKETLWILETYIEDIRDANTFCQSL